MRRYLRVASGITDNAASRLHITQQSAHFTRFPCPHPVSITGSPHAAALTRAENGARSLAPRVASPSPLAPKASRLVPIYPCQRSHPPSRRGRQPNLTGATVFYRPRQTYKYFCITSDFCQMIHEKNCPPPLARGGPAVPATHRIFPRNPDTSPHLQKLLAIDDGKR